MPKLDFPNRNLNLERAITFGRVRMNTSNTLECLIWKNIAKIGIRLATRTGLQDSLGLAMGHLPDGRTDNPNYDGQHPYYGFHTPVCIS